MKKNFLCACCFFLVQGLLAVASVQAEWLSREEAIMGTRVAVTLWAEDKANGEAAIDEVMEEFRRIDRTLSNYKPESDLSLLNQKAFEDYQPVSDEMFLLLEKSLAYSELSDGAFDITFGSVGQHYDFRKGQQPSNDEITHLLPAVNYHLIDLQAKSQSVRFLHKDLKIDLGGIAKGYSVDQAADILKSRGIEHATVSAGGDSRVIGDRRGRPWMVGVKHPRAEDAVAVSLPLADVAVSTSGDYERYFIDSDGQRVHHIINPATGKSAGEVSSVTVLGDHGIDTDALSTTVFVLGIEKGMALLNKLPGIDGIIIDRNGKLYYSQGLAPPSP